MPEMQLMAKLRKSCFKANFLMEIIFMSFYFFQKLFLDCRFVEFVGLLLRAGIIRYKLSVNFVTIAELCYV